jgi:hypothetical protein
MAANGKLTAPDLRAHRSLTLAEAEALTLEQRRVRAANLGYDPDSCDWVNWVLMESLPTRQRREARMRRNMLHVEGRLSRLRREGYSFDEQHRLVAPVRPPAARVIATGRTPRSRRTRRGSASRDGPSSSSDGEPPGGDEPPLRLSFVDTLPEDVDESVGPLIRMQAHERRRAGTKATA